MEFIESIKNVFHNYANFNGRARRSEYWYWTLFSSLIGGSIGFISGIISGILIADYEREAAEVVTGLASVLIGLWGLATFVPSLALCIRRLHDIGKSGVNYLMILIPLAGPIIILVRFCQDSQPGANQYGVSVKYPVSPNGAYYAQNQYQQPNQNNYYPPQQPAQSQNPNEWSH